MIGNLIDNHLGKIVLSLMVVVFALAMVSAWTAGPRERTETINRTTVVEIADGEITYIVQRTAGGRDTIGYGDADFRTITVARDGQCYREVELIRELPVSCALEVR